MVLLEALIFGELCASHLTSVVHVEDSSSDESSSSDDEEFVKRITLVSKTPRRKSTARSRALAATADAAEVSVDATGVSKPKVKPQAKTKARAKAKGKAKAKAKGVVGAIRVARAANAVQAETDKIEDAAASKSKKIVANRDVAQLKVSILEAEAEVILKKNDEPKAKAREIISAAINRLPVNTCALKAAFQAGKDAKLDPSEYKRCEYMLKREEEREQALVDLKVVFDFAKEVDMTQIEAIQVAKTKLSDAITRAKDKGVADKDLKGYELRRRKLLMLWNSRSEDFD